MKKFLVLYKSSVPAAQQMASATNASATAFSAASASLRVENGPMPFIRASRSLTPNLCGFPAASFPPALC